MTTDRRHYSQKLPKPLLDNYEWQYKGECNKHNPETFFLPYNARMSEKTALIKVAKDICAQCPVIAECLSYALDTEQEFGVWGGLSEDERRRILLRRKRTPTKKVA